MNFKCPYCRKECDYMELRMSEDMETIIKIQPAFGKYADLVWAYTELFGITLLRGKTKKILLIQREMKRLFDSGGFSFQRKNYRISQVGIAEALNIVVHRHFEMPLENHNYLKKVMIGIVEKEASAASRETEKQLQQKEKHLMTGYKQSKAETEANRRRVQDIINKIG